MHVDGREPGPGSASQTSSQPPARTWPAIVSTFALLTFASGLTFYAWPVYFDELVVHGFTLRDVSTSLTCFFVLNAVTGLVVARLVGWTDTRTVLLGGTAVCSVALVLLPRVTETWQLLTIFSVLGIGSAASTLVPGTTFLLRRLGGRSAGLAIGMTGLSVGGVVVAPGVAALVERHGLSDSAPFIGLAYLAAVGLPALMMSSRPPSAEVVARATAAIPQVGGGVGDAVAPAGPVAGAATSIAAGRARPGAYARPTVASPTFAVLAGAAAIMLCNHLGPQIHLIHMAEERGVRNAVVLVSTVAGSSLVSRALGAWLLVRFSTMHVFALIGAVQTVSLLLFSVSTSVWGLAAGAALTGFCIGNLSVVMPLMVLEYYGVAHYPRMFGAQQLVVNLGTALGPTVIAALHETTEGYRDPMLLLAVTSAAASGSVVWFVRRYGHGVRDVAPEPSRTGAHDS
jgi:MFS family permease